MKLLVLMLMAVGTTLRGQVSIGITIGPPPPPRVVRVLPPTPGPEFVWVEGYWYPVGHHYKWQSPMTDLPFNLGWTQALGAEQAG